MTLENPVELAGRLAQLRRVWQEAFTVAPYSEPEQGFDWLEQQLRWRQMRPRCCLALDGERVIGFAVGWPTTAGDLGGEWGSLLGRALGGETLADRIMGRFGLAALGVAPSHQGQGWGGRLHDAVLTGLDQDGAWLITYPFDCPARELYRKRGWVELGEGPLGATGAARLILARDLHPRVALPAMG